jgi:hypothetical protein
MYLIVLGFELLNELMSKKRATVIRDVEKAQMLSRFMRWKKVVNIGKSVNLI